MPFIAARKVLGGRRIGNLKKRSLLLSCKRYASFGSADNSKDNLSSLYFAGQDVNLSDKKCCELLPMRPLSSVIKENDKSPGTERQLRAFWRFGRMVGTALQVRRSLHASVASPVRHGMGA
jgi:hypothetical protein